MLPSLPEPSDYEKALSDNLVELIRHEIIYRNGFLPFDQYLNYVLYKPQLGYYARGQDKFGYTGDFITAPELHPIFAQTLATQLTFLLQNGKKVIYEFGAGSGRLAADLLHYLPDDCVTDYYIIELSAPLIARQRATLQTFCPDSANKVIHLNMLPSHLDGIVIANEVLDAMPFHLVSKENQLFFEIGVTLDESENLIWDKKLLTSGKVLSTAHKYLLNCPEPYQTELHLQQQAFIFTLCERLRQGAVILVDYGFDACKYYHPQRYMGTWMGHYRHHSLKDPFFYPGLIDLTTHINFSALAESIVRSNTNLIGYIPQSRFLLNLGITEHLKKSWFDTTEKTYYSAASAVQTLVHPHEMGEIFKVMAFGKNCELEWQGFESGDITHKL